MFDKAIYFTLTLLLYSSSCINKPKAIEVNGLYTTKAFGFSQAVVYQNLIYSSGQVGWNSQGELQNEHDFDQQLFQACENLNSILASQSSNWNDVIHLRFYVLDLDSIKRTSIRKFLDNTYDEFYAPATTLLGISKLAQEGLLIEIEMIAKKGES